MNIPIEYFRWVICNMCNNTRPARLSFWIDYDVTILHWRDVMSFKNGLRKKMTACSLDLSSAVGFLSYVIKRIINLFSYHMIFMQRFHFHLKWKLLQEPILVNAYAYEITPIWRGVITFLSFRSMTNRNSHSYDVEHTLVEKHEPQNI